MISDKYEIIKQLATTDHSEVFLVRHNILSQLRVAKVVSGDKGSLDRIIKEAGILKNLKFSGIPIIYDIEEDDNSICIIEEYISGKSLTEFIKKDITVNDITLIGIRVCEILEYLHKNAGIAHLDIKPANIIVNDENNSFLEKSVNYKKINVYVIDYDSSRRNDEICEESHGTVGYAAPEQYYSIGTIESDIYSVGILFVYMALGGRIQSFTEDTEKVCQRYSTSIGPVIRKCLRHNQNQRFHSMSDLLKELESISHQNGMNLLINEQSEIITEVTAKKTTGIYVNGIKSGIGITHLCLCMSSFLAKKNYSVLCIRHGDIKDYKISELMSMMTEKCTFKIHGIHIMPDYGGCLECDYYGYDYIIHDCGIQRENQHIKDQFGMHEQEQKDITVAICGYRNEYIKDIEKISETTAIFINHISGTAFYRYIRNNTSGKYIYRFPCMYEWYEDNELFGQAVKEFLGISEKKKIFFWKKKEKIYRN